MVRIDVNALNHELMESLILECEEITDWLWAQVKTKAPPGVNQSIIRKEVLVMASKVYGYISNGNMASLLDKRGEQTWMEGIITLSRPYIFERLVKTVKDFPFHKFINKEGGDAY